MGRFTFSVDMALIFLCFSSTFVYFPGSRQIFPFLGMDENQDLCLKLAETFPNVAVIFSQHNTGPGSNRGVPGPLLRILGIHIEHTVEAYLGPPLGKKYIQTFQMMDISLKG